MYKLCSIFQDKEVPILTCPTNQSLETDYGHATAVAVWFPTNATDNSGKNLTTTCNADSGSQFEIGESDIVCETWDPSGNHATCTFAIKVIGRKKHSYFTGPMGLTHICEHFKGSQLDAFNP